jgi:hypothetical protein
MHFYRRSVHVGLTLEGLDGFNPTAILHTLDLH